MPELDDFRVTRNEDDEIDPNEVESPRIGFEVEVIPLTLGDTYNLEGWTKEGQDFTDEDKIYMLRNNVVSVDGESLEVPDDEDEAVEYVVNTFSPYLVQDLVDSVQLGSGLESMLGKERMKEMVDAIRDEAEAQRSN